MDHITFLCPNQPLNCPIEGTEVDNTHVLMNTDIELTTYMHLLHVRVHKSCSLEARPIMFTMIQNISRVLTNRDLVVFP